MHSFFLSILAVLMLAASAGTVLAQKSELSGVVNVNTATAEQLELLPGVGPARASSIIAYRRQSGGFKSVNELTQIDGIGDKALAKIRSHCAIEGKTTARLDAR